MKDECRSKITTQFIELKFKIYSIKIDDMLEINEAHLFFKSFDIYRVTDHFLIENAIQTFQ